MKLTIVVKHIFANKTEKDEIELFKRVEGSQGMHEAEKKKSLKLC